MSAATHDHSDRQPEGLRCRQPGVTPDTVERAISLHDRLRDVGPYAPHLRWWIARYSRGDDRTSLREAFADVVDQVDRDGEAASSDRGAGALLFEYGAGFIGRYRHALVLLSIALCLRLPDAAHRVLRWCERGDPLIERLAAANGAPPMQTQVAPPFPDEFDGLYAALGVSAPAPAAESIRAYLAVWLDDRMDDMGFKIADEGVGYWCFEAAGLVAVLELDESTYAGEPVYPADLVAFYRDGG